MKRKLLLPIPTAGAANAPAASPNIGFVQFSEGHNLGTISADINASPFVGDDIGDHAIPSILAHLQYTEEVVQRGDTTSDAFLPWQGVLAMVGLAGKYGFRLTMTTIDLRDEDTLLGRILDESLAREGVAFDGRLSVICRDSIPLALTHPGILLCPFKTIRPQALQDVPWVQDGRWADVCSCLKNDEREYLAAWISTFLDSVPAATASALRALSLRLTSRQDETVRQVRALSAAHPLYRAWRGVLSMIGLSQMYGYSLSFRQVNLLADNAGARDLIEKCLPKKAVLSEQSMTVLYRDEYPLAVMHPDVILCPLEDISPAALAGVPWYRDGEWTDVPSSVGQAERDSLASWLSSARVTDQALKPAVDGFLSELTGGRPLIAPGKTCRLADPQLFQGRRIGVSSVEDFLKAPSFPVDMPPIFNDRLAVVFAAPDAVLGIGHPLHFSVERNGRAVYFNALAPLTPELTACFTQREDTEEGAADIDSGASSLRNREPILDLNSIRLDVSRFAASRSITVEVTLQNGSFLPVRSHTYTADHIDYIPNLPYLTLWPYVSLPPRHWKSYYVSLLGNTGDAGQGAVDGVHEVNGNRLSIDCSPVYKESGYENYGWRVAVLRRMPRFVHFCYQENNETRQSGCLFVSPPEDPALKCTNFSKSAVMGVDFGTTNTICSIKVSGGKLNHTVTRGAYLKDLTPPKDKAEKEIFTSQYWMPQEDKEGKFLSIAQLYANCSDRSDMLPYEEGSMMFVDQKVLNHFLSQSGDGAMRTLSEIGIYNDMKFGRDPLEGGNAEESFASRIFLKNVLLDACLAAKLKGAEVVSLNISYPQEKVKKELQTHWDEARSFIEKLDCSLRFTGPDPYRIHFLTEAEAASRFFDQQLRDGLAADPEAGFAIVDIGGGTADISVWKADPLPPGQAGKPNPAKEKGKFSLLYAGREIVVKSLYQQFPDGATEEFRNLWNNAGEPETQQLFQRYDSLVKAVDSHHNLDTDPIYKNIRMILDILIDKCSFRYDHIFRPGTQSKYSRLVAVMRMKFLNVFYVLAQYIRELGAVDNRAGTFKIFLAGGSSQALRFCSMGEDLRSFGSSSFGEYLRVVVGEILGTGPDGVQIVEPQTSDKREVAIGLTIPAESLTVTQSGSRFGAYDEQEEPSLQAEVPTEGDGEIPYGAAELRDQWKESYNLYINRYMHRKGGTFEYQSLSGMKDLYESLTLTNPENAARFSQSKVFSRVYGNAEYPQSIKPYIFAALMADRLL